MNDSALKSRQKRLNLCMGPLTKIWEEVGNLDKKKSSMIVEELKELIEKKILMIGQTNVACLFECKLNYLPKIMHSAKLARQALYENESTFDGIGKLYGSNFYANPDPKVKCRN